MKEIYESPELEMIRFVPIEKLMVGSYEGASYDSDDSDDYFVIPI